MSEPLTATLKDSFLTFMRHELRTPLNAMLGYTELLREELHEHDLPDDRDAIAAGLDTIAASTRQVLALIADLLDPARGVEGHGSIESLGVDEAVAHLRRAIRTPLDAVLSHAEMLLVRAEDRSDLAFLADLESVHAGALELHRNLDEIVQLHHLRTGALERRALKRSRTELLVVAGDASRDKSALRASLVGRILVVDDLAANRDILCRRLERLGHETVAVASGAEALRAVAASTFDLVLLDLVMPDMSGFTVLQRMRAHAATRDVPVIVVSAMDALDSTARCIAEGAEDVLSKPCDAVLLRARVAASIEKKRLRDRELAYLHAVERVTAAARQLEANRFDAAVLGDIARRNDPLGSLGRVFIKMADEVRRREERLAAQVRELKVGVDPAQVSAEVDQITGSEFWRDLEARAMRLARKRRDGAPPGDGEGHDP